LFDRVRCSENSQDLFAKVVVIDGDITLDGLGITLGNAEILKSNVSIVFHVTANVNFNSGLKNLVKANTEGTHNVLKCSKQFHRLKAFVYVSTAFSNSYLEEIEERIYPPTLDPHFVMLLCSELQPDLINLLTEKLMYKHKICYTFFKHLAESLIHEARFDYPVCIVRPTIVGPAHLEPYPGWVDNFTGMCGYMAGMSQGIVRCMYSNRQGTVEIVPVDHVVNVTLTAAMNVSSKIFQIQNDVIVYNCSNTEHPFAYKQFQPSLLEACEKYPFNETFWRPLLVIVRNKIMFSILNFLLQYIPAVVVDGVAMLMEKKPRMLKIYGKVQALTDAVREIQRTDFRFRTDNMKDKNNIAICPKQGNTSEGYVCCT
ncbi:unnamed protein product, partial [Allacma fusca]